jgi:ABC-type transport system involved in multi-copper enzyme maturation permease subunit
MSWVTWRQHRIEGAWTVVIAAVLALLIAFVAYELHAARAGCPGLVVGYCFGDDMLGQLAQRIAQFNLYTYGLVVLPALAGAFIGCPLVAREIENGTHRLAWTQGVTRTRWIVTKLALVFVPILVLAAAVGALEVILISQMGANPNRWAYFDQQTPMTVAATLFALGLGVAVGAVVGRSVPAMAVTLVAYVVVRIGLAEIARPIYMAPVAYTTHDMSTFSSPPNGYADAWWVDQASIYDSSGHLISNGGPGGLGAQAAYAVQHFQPADRFWTFQSIESGILIALAAIAIAVAIYWVIRRVS